MKGVILAGGTGSRLDPITRVTNKHLLPVFNKPMIYYPIEKMKEMGITEIIMVIGIEFASHFPAVLGHGEELGVKINYVLQDEPLGIAHALFLTRDFVKGDNVCVILGDNIFDDPIRIDDFTSGARVFLKEVSNPKRFGVATIKDRKVIEIEEKPENPKSDYAVTGIYMFDNTVFDIIRDLKPSARGEYELTDVNNVYISRNQLDFQMLNFPWNDAGTFESMYKTSKMINGDFE